MNAIGQQDNTVQSPGDIEAIESIPLAERGLPDSTYKLIADITRAQPNAVAIRYIENGDSWRTGLDGGVEPLSVDISYQELLANIHRAANLFRHLGVGDNDVVSMLLPNIPEAHYTLWGGEATGIVNPVNYMLAAEVIAEIIESAGSKILVAMGVHPEFDIAQKLETIRSKAPCLEHVIVIGEPASEQGAYLRFAEAMQLQNAETLAFNGQISPNKVASLFHTGGTTGVPKLAMHSHSNEVYTAWAMNSMLDARSDDRVLSGLPLFHCNAAIGTGLAVFASGGTVVLAGINGYRTSGILPNLFQLIDHFKITKFSGVPTIFSSLLQLPTTGCDLSSVRFAICGAAPMPVELFKSFQKATGIKVIEGYGLTEATVCSTLTPPAAEEPRIGSIGLRLPYTQVQAAQIDHDGRYLGACPVDGVGTLLIGGPSVTPGYTDASKNAGLFVTDKENRQWLNTGDLARQDEDGYFWLVGRAKELIIRGGHNIDPKTIEEALAAHPSVHLAAAVGRPDSYAGEVPVAYVEVVAPVSERDLLAFCKETIGERAAVPKAIVILNKLPVTAVGKIHKPTLHLMEIETIVRRELDQLGSLLRSYTVTAYMDEKLGNSARIELECVDSAGANQTEEAIRRILDGFSFGYHLVLKS